VGNWCYCGINQGWSSWLQNIFLANENKGEMIVKTKLSAIVLIVFVLSFH